MNSNMENIVNLSKLSIDSVSSSKEKSILSKNAPTSKKFIQNKSNVEKYNLDTKTQSFVFLIDPLMISSIELFICTITCRIA